MAHFRRNRGAFGGPGERVSLDWRLQGRTWNGTFRRRSCLVHDRARHPYRGLLSNGRSPSTARAGVSVFRWDGLFLEEKQDLDHQVERISPSQGYRISRHDSEGRFSFVKEVIADPTRPCVQIHTKLEGNGDFLRKLRNHVLCAPHLEVGGEGKNGYVVEVSGHLRASTIPPSLDG